MFDWMSFLSAHGIEFKESGPNVKRGYVGVACPFCGDDPSTHMGLSLSSNFWGCWRDPTHRGHSIPKLIQSLLGCDWRRANQLAGDWKDPAPLSDTDLVGLAGQLSDEEDSVLLPEPIRYPSTPFKVIRHSDRRTGNYFDYLANRGFRVKDVETLCNDYELRGAIGGDWRGRLILPLLGLGGKVYGWQGRAIGQSKYRYLSYPNGSRIKQLLFNYGPAHRAKLRKVLVICEGPLDALKLDFYGRDVGIRAVGVMGTSFVGGQVDRLFKLVPRYERALVLFDPQAESSALDLMSRLSLFNPVLGSVPEGVEDPGALRPSQVVSAVMSAIRQ